MNKIETAADLLAGTREYIETNGLYKGDFFDDEEEDPIGKVCTLGGMLRTLDLFRENCNHPLILQACTTLSRVVGIRLHNPESCARTNGLCTCSTSWVVHWNDQRDRTEQEVLDALAKAEKVERGLDPDAA